MKLKRSYLVALIWIILIIAVKKMNIISFDMTTMLGYLKANQQTAMAILLLLWVGRLLLFIPGVIFMVLGGVFFGPINGFLLSALGMVLSETILFLVSKSFVGLKLKQMISKRYSDIEPLIELYNYKFLALGIICPIAPTDAVCILTVSSGINYIKYIITVLLANLPLILIYSSIGVDTGSSSLSIVLVLITSILIGIFSINIWNNLKGKVRLN